MKPMKTIFVKYNLGRKDQFSLKTIIYESRSQASNRVVVKYPVTKTAAPFLRQIAKNIETFRAFCSPALDVCSCEQKDGSLLFPFIQGENYQQFLLHLLDRGNQEGFVRAIEQYRDMILGGIGGISSMNDGNEAFVNVFGLHPIAGGGFGALSVSNIDLSFENLILPSGSADGKWCVIDCEWVFSFPIPVEYILYRNVGTFFSKFGRYIYKQVALTFEDIMTPLHLKEEMLDTLRGMEKGFQCYVHEDSDTVYGAYLKRGVPLKWHLERSVAWQKNTDDVKIYWPDDAGAYCEENMTSVRMDTPQKQRSYQGTETILVPMPTETPVDQLIRMDITARPSAFRVERVQLVDEEQRPLADFDIVWCNGNYQRDGYTVFLHDDAQVYCKLQSMKPKASTEYFLQIIVAWCPLSVLLETSHDEKNTLTNKLSVTEERLKRTENELNYIKNTRYWKFRVLIKRSCFHSRDTKNE